MPVGVDVGGTFTDVAYWDGERLVTGKVPTSPDQADAVLEGMAGVGAGSAALVHGTTAATNAVLQRSGAVTALVTDEGFEDVLEIGRQDRPSLYDTTVTRTAPLVPAGLRFGVPGRDDSAPDTVGLADAIRAAGAESVAVATLFGFDRPDRERAIAAALGDSLSLPISVSYEVAPEIREFERFSTTVLNAFVLPVVETYLRRLAASVEGEPRIMRSSGGLMALEDAARLPAAILLSGPAGGAVAAAALGSALGHRRVISFDMGGTSTDVCRIEDGRPGMAYRREIDGLPNSMPSVAIHTVGAGGGSIGWVDEGGALRVGPRSAGAAPGPASYRRGGTEPTVTDADLALGRIGSSPLGGQLVLDFSAAETALTAIGERLGGMDAMAVARGIVEVVEAHMERAVRRVSVDEGADPREAVLVAFGGAGGLHATALARRLDMAGVLIPPHAGVFSALGLLLAPPRLDRSQSVILDGLEGVASAAETLAGAASTEAGGGIADLALDVRYRGQSHETTIPYEVGEDDAVVIERFHAAHEVRNGFARRGDPVEVVTIRASVVGAPALQWSDLPPLVGSEDSVSGTRSVVGLDGVRHDAEVHWRPGLRPGDEVVGPAVVEEPEATTYLGPGERLTVHESGALEVEW